MREASAGIGGGLSRGGIGEASGTVGGGVSRGGNGAEASGAEGEGSTHSMVAAEDAFPVGIKAKGSRATETRSDCDNLLILTWLTDQHHAEFRAKKGAVPPCQALEEKLPIRR
jgi:hypothetical protein